ncbi:MAG TPA: CARDB domain-containing protein [Chloroflexota bacterium]|nr:CARDB domain-containing protein [Chloroflexota bacterium]
MLSLPTIARGASTLALAATLLAPVLAPSTPALAEEPIVRDHRDPYARVQVVIKRITIHEDRDWGNGEIAISFTVNSYRAGCTPFSGAACETRLLSGGIPEFSASDDTVKAFDRVIPSYGDSVTDDAISPPFGIPLRPGTQYGLSIRGDERDPTIDDRLGFLNTLITDKDGQVQFGTRTERGFLNDCDLFGGCGTEQAKYSVEYEIRRVPLPDLRPVNIKIYDLPGNPKQLVCAAVQNIETADAGSFEVALKVDGVVPPGGRATAGRLASGDAGELCAEIALPATGQHQLSAVVDESEGVLEYNERNNVYDQAYTAPNQVGSAGSEPETTANKPAPNAAAAQADLTVAALKVNGQAPDGQNDCKDGKNTVAVVVKNAGSEKVGAFAVRLDADGDELSVESVDGLEAGKEREVRFEDVKLKKGEHKLTASVDAKTTVAESNEENNDRQVTARCQGDS